MRRGRIGKERKRKERDREEGKERRGQKRIELLNHLQPYSSTTN
jgi:uncharacterized protein YeeX (DUF496 family)